MSSRKATKNNTEKKFRGSTRGGRAFAALFAIVACGGALISGCAGVANTSNASPAAQDAIQISPANITFSNVTVGQKATQSAMVTNTGSDGVTITQVAASSAQFSATGITTPMSLAPGQSAAFQIIFTSTKTGSVTGTLSVLTSHGGSATNVALSASTQSAPSALTLSANSLNFGNVPTTGSGTQNLTLSNGGQGDIHISQIGVTGTGYSVSGVATPVTVPAGQSVGLQAKFSPVAAGAASGAIAISSDAQNPTSNVSLNGMGMSASYSMSLSPASVSFGKVSAGSSATQNVVLSNTGNSSVTVTKVTASGAGISVSGATMPVTILPSQNLTLSVKYAPATSGAASGSLTVTNDQGVNAVAAVSGTGVQAGLSVAPGSLSFGPVGTGKSSSQAVQLTNSGSANLTISQVTAAGTGFSFSGLTLPVTLTPGQSASFSAKYAPTAVGNATGSVSIVSNAPNSPTAVALSGTGVQAGLSVAPGSLSFGPVGTGKSSSQAVQLTNSGSANLTISQVSATGTGFSISGLTLPLTLTPGQSASFSAQYAPQAAGNATGSVSIVSNAPNSPSAVALSGTGVQAGLSLTPSTAAFGSVVTGNTDSQTIQVKNTGTASLTISKATVTGTGFSVSGLTLPMTLTAGQSGNFNVQYAPTAGGSATGSLSIASNAPNSPSTVALTATGVAATHTITVSPSTLSFGSVTDGSSTSQSFTVTNSGNSNVAITGMVATGSGYAISSGAGAVTLSPNQATVVAVQFAPSSAGAKNGSVSIASNATGSTSSVSLSGTGVAPATSHTVALNWGASTSSVAGYNVYRSQVSGSAYVKVNGSLVGGVSYSDSSVQGGQTYFYVATAVDSGGNESVFSNEISTVIP